MTKAEMILKVVLVPHERVDNFIESYNKLLPDSDTNEFQKILDMKGVKRAESNILLEAFKSRSVPKDSTGLSGSNFGDSSSAAQTLDHESSRIKRLEKLIKKRL